MASVEESPELAIGDLSLEARIAIAKSLDHPGLLDGVKCPAKGTPEYRLLRKAVIKCGIARKFRLSAWIYQLLGSPTDLQFNVILSCIRGFSCIRKIIEKLQQIHKMPTDLKLIGNDDLRNIERSFRYVYKPRRLVDKLIKQIDEVYIVARKDADDELHLGFDDINNIPFAPCGTCRRADHIPEKMYTCLDCHCKPGCDHTDFDVLKFFMQMLTRVHIIRYRMGRTVDGGETVAWNEYHWQEFYHGFLTHFELSKLRSWKYHIISPTDLESSSDDAEG